MTTQMVAVGAPAMRPASAFVLIESCGAPALLGARLPLAVATVAFATAAAGASAVRGVASEREQATVDRSAIATAKRSMGWVMWRWAAGVPIRRRVDARG